MFGSLSSAASAATAAPATMTPHSTSTGYIFPGRILPNSIAFSGKPADICMAQVRRMAGRSKFGEMPSIWETLPSRMPAARSVFMSRALILKASVTHSPSSAGMLNRSASRALSV